MWRSQKENALYVIVLRNVLAAIMCLLYLCFAQAIYAEGKTHALAVGVTKLSTKDMYV